MSLVHNFSNVNCMYENMWTCGKEVETTSLFRTKLVTTSVLVHLAGMERTVDRTEMSVPPVLVSMEPVAQ